MPSPPPSAKPGLAWRVRRALERWLVRRFIRLVSPHREWREAVHGWNFQQENRPLSDPRVRVGRHTYGVQARSVFMARDDDRLTVGNFCSIARDVRFIFGNHPLDTVTTFPLRTILRDEWADNVDALSRGPITVGNDVWIASDAIVLSGVAIGDGAVVGAGAVVTRDVAPYSLVAGAPARHVRYRLSESQIADLRKICWWDWPDEIILANVDLFYGDVDRFIHRFLPRPTA